MAGWGHGWMWWLVSMRGKARWGWSHVRGCRSTSRVRGVDTDDVRSHRRQVAQFWLGLSWNWSVFLGIPWHGTSQEGSNSLSMQPVSCTPCCSTDNVAVVAENGHLTFYDHTWPAFSCWLPPTLVFCADCLRFVSNFSVVILSLLLCLTHGSYIIGDLRQDCWCIFFMLCWICHHGEL